MVPIASAAWQTAKAARERWRIANALPADRSPVIRFRERASETRPESPSTTQITGHRQSPVIQRRPTKSNAIACVAKRTGSIRTNLPRTRNDENLLIPAHSSTAMSAATALSKLSEKIKRIAAAIGTNTLLISAVGSKLLLIGSNRAVADRTPV